MTRPVPERNLPYPKEQNRFRCFRRFLHSIGMPVNFAELGVKEEDIPKLVEKFGIGDGKTGGFVHLSAADIAEIYRIAAHAAL